MIIYSVPPDRIIIKAIEIVVEHKKYKRNIFLKAMYSQSKKEKKKNTTLKFNTKYRKEMKLVLINIDYCLLSFDAY